MAKKVFNLALCIIITCLFIGTGSQELLAAPLKVKEVPNSYLTKPKKVIVTPQPYNNRA